MFNKKLSYRRAEWVYAFEDPQPLDGLSALTQRYVDQNSTVRERSVQDGGSLLFLNRLEPGSRNSSRLALLGELVSVTPDRAAEVASMELFHSKSIDIEAIDPSPGQSFVDGRLFFLSLGMHLIVAADFRLREASLTSYINSAFRPELVPANVAIKLNRIADTDKIEAIRIHGVKSITLNAVLYEETMRWFDSGSDTLTRRIKDHILALVEKELHPSEVLRQSNLQAELTLSFSGRSTAIEQTSLGNIAEAVVNTDDESYSIKLGNDNVVKASELVHLKPVRVPSRHKQIDHIALWSKMEEYFSELGDSGALEM